MFDFIGGYPILLNLRNKPVAVVGGGRVAARKVKGLLASGARPLVISPALTSDLQAMAAEGKVQWIQAAYRRGMLNGCMPVLVIATTDDARVNQAVAQDAHRIRALVNVTDGGRDDSDFSNMALIHQPPLTIALTTHGTSPTLLRQLKARLTEALGDEYLILSSWLGEIRQPLKSEIDAPAERRRVYRQIVESDVLPLLRSGKSEQARRVFQRIIFEGRSQ